MTANHSQEPEAATKDPQTLIGLLQTELATTNREVMLLTLELEERIAERMAQLSQTNQELLKEISERRQAEEKVSKLNRQLEQRAELLEATNKELETFSYSVSHDLRAPLRHILGFATMLHEDAVPPLDKNLERHLSRIKESATRMSTLIDDLLHFAHCSQVELNRELVDLNAIVESVLRDHGAEIEGRNIVWKRTQLPSAWGDPALVRQVVVNLISNALKYSRLSDPTEIEIGVVENDPRETVFFVRDNGVGFDPHYADKLFGVFQRLHKASEFEGTGVGLANVRRIIARHGGKTWANSAVGKGATFYFSLPVNLSTSS
jgi:light-regulated signal transduction histidine kinase (bacteriophytochrome)